MASAGFEPSDPGDLLRVLLQALEGSGADDDGQLAQFGILADGLQHVTAREPIGTPTQVDDQEAWPALPDWLDVAYGVEIDSRDVVAGVLFKQRVHELQELLVVVDDGDARIAVDHPDCPEGSHS